MKKIVITVGGPPGAGSTSVAKEIAKRFNLRYISLGKIFRNIAKKRGIEVEKLSEVAETEIDLEVDAKSKEEALKGNVVIESKLAAFINKDINNNTLLIKIWLTASLEKRAKRIFNDTEKRIAENFKSIEEVKERIQRRYEKDKKRYEKYYGFDLEDLNIYDLVINTENLNLNKVIEKVFKFIKNRIEEVKV